MKTTFYAFTQPDPAMHPGLYLGRYDTQPEAARLHPGSVIVPGPEEMFSLRADGARLGFYPVYTTFSNEPFRDMRPWRAYVNGECIQHFTDLPQALAYMARKGFRFDKAYGMIVCPVSGKDEHGPFWELRIATGYRAGKTLRHAGIREDLRWRNFKAMQAWAEETGYTFIA